MRRDVTWIATDGGPLVLLPAEVRAAWLGSFLPGDAGDFVVETDQGPFGFRSDYDFENPRTDYERACAVAGYAGGLDVEGATALVLGDEPLDTTWLPLPDGGLLARIDTVEAGADADAELDALGTGGPWEPLGVTLPGGRYLLLDALDLGSRPEREPLAVELAPGTYEVLTARVATASVSWRCIRLAAS